MLDYDLMVYDFELLLAYNTGYEFSIINEDSYVLFFNDLIQDYNVDVPMVKEAYEIYENDKFSIVMDTVRDYILYE